MFSNKLTLNWSFAKSILTFITFITMVAIASTAAASNKTTTKGAESNSSTSSSALVVYKNPSCGCCKKWISHIDQNGFQSTVHNRLNLSELKISKGIAPQYRSCHTALSKDGYVFEGHVPAKFINQFLAEKPQDALGLSVPAMPIGTPGMEMGERFMPYQVLLLKTDGTSEVYSMVNSYKEQF